MFLGNQRHVMPIAKQDPTSTSKTAYSVPSRRPAMTNLPLFLVPRPRHHTYLIPRISITPTVRSFFLGLYWSLTPHSFQSPLAPSMAPPHSLKTALGCWYCHFPRLLNTLCSRTGLSEWVVWKGCEIVYWRTYSSLDSDRCQEDEMDRPIEMKVESG